jgi:methylmalonyl-CoA mutase N-terminal domain/subunit
MNFFEEIAKFRAARRLWAKVMKGRFSATDPKSMMLRFHTQTGGATLTAQQPENNIVRTALEALAAVLGGTQSLHTNSYDEALSLPTEKSVMIALRTQQVLGYESGVADTVDPLAGSYFIESLTNELEELATELLGRVDELGGAVEAVDSGWVKAQIEESAFRINQGVESGERVVVGVNKFKAESEEPVEIYNLDPELERRQVTRLQELRSGRDAATVEKALGSLGDAARGSDNLLYPMKEALAAYATLGEVSDTLREVYGEYEPRGSF